MSRATRLNRFVSAIVALGAVVAALTLVLPQHPLEWSWWGAVVLLVAVRVAEAGSVEITRESEAAGYGISVATVPQLACALLLPPPIACVVAGASMLLDEINNRSPVSRMAFNVASTTLSVGLTAIVAGLLGISGGGLGVSGWTGMASFLLVAGCYYLVNTLPVACVGALAGGRRVWPAMIQSARSTAVAEFAFALLGGLAAFVWVTNPYWLLIGVAPAIISQLALRYVAQRNRKSAELERMAFHDALTGLPNRELLAVQLEQALRRTAAGGAPVAVLFLDVDRFKEINDTFGHRYGDVVLQQIGLRLAAELPSSATLARLAGDEFAVLLPEANAAEASRVAESLLRALARTVQVHDVTLDVGASIGVAAAPEHATQPDILLRQADVAMYVAKRRRGGYVVYSPDQDTHSRDRLKLAADLRGAVERDELRLHYQPIVSLETGCMEEVEALVRWEHPQRGLVSPGEFIPIAEETGMIIPIGRWVMEQACRQAVSWRESFDAAQSLVVSVNLSARQFHHTDVPAEVSKIIHDTGMDPRLLKLEITESIAMGDTELNLATLWLLKGMGLRLAIDDFGTGYSSLGYLKRFPVETLKIDKGFVDGLGVHPEDAAVIGAIIAFARAVGLNTTAEGVEDVEQLVRLRQLGADRVQGFYCSKPLPAEELAELLSKPRPLFHEGLPTSKVARLALDAARDQVDRPLSERAA